MMHAWQANFLFHSDLHIAVQFRHPKWAIPAAWRESINGIRLTPCTAMAGDPPDFLVAPRLAFLHLLDFHRAEEAIDEGRRAAEKMLHDLPALFELP